MLKTGWNPQGLQQFPTQCGPAPRIGSVVVLGPEEGAWTWKWPLGGHWGSRARRVWPGMLTTYPGSAGCPRLHQGEASDGDVYGGPLALHSGALTYAGTPLATLKGCSAQPSSPGTLLLPLQTLAAPPGPPAAWACPHHQGWSHCSPPHTSRLHTLSQLPGEPAPLSALGVGSVPLQLVALWLGLSTWGPQPRKGVSSGLCDSFQAL